MLDTEPRDHEDGPRRAVRRDRLEPGHVVARAAVELVARADRRPGRRGASRSPGVSGVQWHNLAHKVIIPAFIAPTIAFAAAFVLLIAIFWVFQRMPSSPANRTFRIGQLFSVEGVRIPGSRRLPSRALANAHDGVLLPRHKALEREPPVVVGRHVSGERPAQRAAREQSIAIGEPHPRAWSTVPVDESPRGETPGPHSHDERAPVPVPDRQRAGRDSGPRDGTRPAGCDDRSGLSRGRSHSSRSCHQPSRAMSAGVMPLVAAPVSGLPSGSRIVTARFRHGVRARSQVDELEPSAGLIDAYSSHSHGDDIPQCGPEKRIGLPILPPRNIRGRVAIPACDRRDDTRSERRNNLEPSINVRPAQRDNWRSRWVDPLCFASVGEYVTTASTGLPSTRSFTCPRIVGSPRRRWKSNLSGSVSREPAASRVIGM